jgi:SAM-dependent methyltransferase
MLQALTKQVRRTAYRLVTRQRRAAYSPDIEVIGNSDRLVRDLLRDELHKHGGSPRILDVGGRKGERADMMEGYAYEALDVIPRAEHVRVGDICHCPDIPDATYDVVFSFDVFEHVNRPWDAAKECIRITKPGGLLVHRTLFAYRYHPNPVDYWRFTSQGLEYLFTVEGGVDTVLKGYDVRGRRRDRRGVPMHNNLDVPPIDVFGGFRENWQVLYVGRKRS